MTLGEVDLPDGRVQCCAQRSAAHRRHHIHRNAGAQQSMGEIDRRAAVRPVGEVGQKQGDGKRGGGERWQRNGSGTVLKTGC